MAITKFGQSRPKVKSVKLHKKGQKYAGIIISEPIQKQQTVYGGAPGELATWGSGDPKMQWIFQLLTTSEEVCQCEEFCQDGAKTAEYGTEADDGVRTLYVGTSGHLINAMVDAMKSVGAVDSHGDPDIQVGGTFAIQRTGLDYERAKKTGGKPPATYAAAYKPPTQETLAKVAAFQSVAEPSSNGNGSSSSEKAMLDSLLNFDDPKADAKLSLSQMQKTKTYEDIELELNGS